ncbi:macro domain-containing protein [Streptomyces sp. NBC_00510]
MINGLGPYNNSANDPPVRHVIHTVGPVREGGDHGEADVLASCYRRCPEVADELGATRIMFPAIATGVHDRPAEEAARIAVSALRASQSRVRQTRLVACDRATRDLPAAALGS